MKLTKRQLNIIIERYLLEFSKDQTSEEEILEAFEKVGITLYMITTLSKFLSITPASVQNIVFSILNCGLEAETEAIIVENIIWFAENVEALDVSLGVVGGLTGYQSLATALSMGAVTLGVTGFMIALPTIVLQQIKDSKKIENQLEKMHELKEKTSARTGKPLSVDDINKNGYLSLLALMIKDKKEGNDTLNRLFNNKVIDNNVVDKVINQYKDYTSEDFDFKEDLSFDDSDFEKIFLVLKYILLIFPIFQNCMEAGSLYDPNSFLESIESGIKTAKKRKDEIKSMTLKVLKYMKKV